MIPSPHPDIFTDSQIAVLKLFCRPHSIIPNLGKKSGYVNKKRGGECGCTVLVVCVFNVKPCPYTPRFCMKVKKNIINLNRIC